MQPLPTPTQAVVIVISDNIPTVESSPTPMAEPSPTIIGTSTEESTREPTIEPTPETVLPIEEPTPTLAESLTPTAPPTATRAPTPIVTIIMVTPTPSPTPVLPAYPQPRLIAPPNLDLNADKGIFSGRPAQPRLEWEATAGLGPNDFYTVAVSFPGATSQVFGGATTKNTFWYVDQRFYDEIAGSQRDFNWSVVVSHFASTKTNPLGAPEPIGEGTEVSPRSEERVFRWK